MINKHQSMVAENSVKAGAAGGIKVIIKAMKKHISNANMCHYGCGAINNMMIYDSK